MPAPPSDGPGPPIPLWLATQPTRGGLVVPWITAIGPDGEAVFGLVDPHRQLLALVQRRCQICGRGLSWPAVLLVRARDLPRGCSAEPALHPGCAHYTRQTCPMIAGRMSHYRTGLRPLAEGATHPPDTAMRQGAAAEDWFSVWIAGYRVGRDPHTGGPVAFFDDPPPLKIRPVTGSAPPHPRPGT